ncbi:hypothetical protein L1049_000680 [Liquidambar formosana]|uniref:EGF-like domain-containing protein n=1 Tax=Liquidambar formosana TaxID=63359 RepID=A0AAP0N9F9_LIQFO
MSTQRDKNQTLPGITESSPVMSTLVTLVLPFAFLEDWTCIHQGGFSVPASTKNNRGEHIDECHESSISNHCDKKAYCVNKEGSYTCSCRKGYHGDGRKNGKGCIANPLHAIQVALVFRRAIAILD